MAESLVLKQTSRLLKRARAMSCVKVLLKTKMAAYHQDSLTGLTFHLQHHDPNSKLLQQHHNLQPQDHGGRPYLQTGLIPLTLGLRHSLRYLKSCWIDYRLQQTDRSPRDQGLVLTSGLHHSLRSRSLSSTVCHLHHVRTSHGRTDINGRKQLNLKIFHLHPILSYPLATMEHQLQGAELSVLLLQGAELLVLLLLVVDPLILHLLRGELLTHHLQILFYPLVTMGALHLGVAFLDLPLQVVDPLVLLLQVVDPLVLQLPVPLIQSALRQIHSTPSLISVLSLSLILRVLAHCRISTTTEVQAVQQDPLCQDLHQIRLVLHQVLGHLVCLLAATSSLVLPASAHSAQRRRSLISSLTLFKLV